MKSPLLYRIQQSVGLGRNISEPQLVESRDQPTGRDSIYRNAILNGLAALLIDMQDEFLNAIEPREKDALVAAQVETISALNTNNVPIFVLEYGGSGQTLEVLRKAAEKNPRCEIVKKWYNNGFHNTDLTEMVAKVNTRRLLLMEINAPYCVKDTGQGALDKGYPLYTARNLIANQRNDKAKFSAALHWFRSVKGAYFGNHKEMLALFPEKAVSPSLAI